MTDTLPIETHPWAPFAPAGAKVLIMGTFPPSPKRWCMDFYYPNPTNDFWKMCGLLFLGSADALYVKGTRRFDPGAIRRLMTDRGIALHDTCRRIRRLQGNASDKFLDVVETVDLTALLELLPDCCDVATTGERAASIIAEITGTAVPRIGEYIEADFAGRHLRVWRMPSTSRAYPLALEKKAAFYATLFRDTGVL